jgi:tetratricopeptide (TPR) repeat protein
MSRTYLAYEPSLDRRVVVKVLAPELLEGLSVERVKREVLMAAKLQHSHVVPVLSSGDADGLPWFSMPFVAGESLRQRLLRGPVPLDEAMGILRDVARALAYAHGQGIVHRDIKPDNVLLSGGSATVTDFGIAKAISASRAVGTATALTRTPGGGVKTASTLATMALTASPHVSWTRTWRVGAVAIAALLLLVTGFVTTRALGIGPAASLIGKGTFGERETIVVADFRPPQGDSLIGTTVAEALRTDLAQSANLAVLTRATIRDILDRMQRPRESTVFFPLAREIATREGARAVVDGEIVRLGTRYVLSARLVSSIDGLELATFRETASDDGSLVMAVGALSRSIRERVGESLKGIRKSSPLERVTTSSLPALRKYVEATRLQTVTGNDDRALQLLEEAVALDSTFAMAWRRIAVILTNSGGQLDRARLAASTAMRFRDRLSDEERAFTEAYYYTRGPAPDLTKAVTAYEEVLRRDSTNALALNNLAVTYIGMRRYDEAIAALRRSMASPSITGNNYLNLAYDLAAVRDTLAADSAVALFTSRLPNHAQLWWVRAVSAHAKGRYDSVAAEARATLRTSQNRGTLLVARSLLGDFAARRGRPREFLANTVAQRQVQFSDSGAVTMSAMADSALVAAYWDGNNEQARAQLRRVAMPALVASVAPAERAWLAMLRAAVLAEDAAAAQTAAAGYARDQAAFSGSRAHDDALAKASVALAAKRFDEGIAHLREAIAQRASPDNEEAFLMAMSHERAGRADSAIVWLQRALTTPTEAGFGGVIEPVAKRKLAELLDAKGDQRGALRYYEAFLADWTNPEPGQAGIVRTVKARVAELRAKLSPG